MGATVEEGVIWVLVTEGEKVVLSCGTQLLLFTPCHSFYGKGGGCNTVALIFSY